MRSPGQGKSKCSGPEVASPGALRAVRVFWGRGSDFLYDRLKPVGWGRASQGLICVFTESLWFLSGSQPGEACGKVGEVRGWWSPGERRCWPGWGQQQWERQTWLNSGFLSSRVIRICQRIGCGGGRKRKVKDDCRVTNSGRYHFPR